MTSVEAIKGYGAFPLAMHRAGVPSQGCFGFVGETGFGHAQAHAGEILSAQEAATLMRCQTDSRRRSYLTGRFAAKMAAALYLGGVQEDAGHSIEIVSGVFQQPVVRCTSPDAPGVTLSHTEGLAVAIAHDPGHIMGVDVERLGSRGAAFLDRFFTAPEQRFLRELPFGEEANAVMLWTMKEALSKAIRCGLTAPVAILEVGEVQLESGGLRAEFSNFGQYKCHAWVAAGYALSIVLPKKTELTFECRGWLA